MASTESSVTSLSSASCVHENQAPSSMIGNSLEVFKFFSQLPIELQLDIWKYTVKASQMVPRVVRVTYHATSNSFTWSFDIPALMTVCQLSRQLAQTVYPSLLPHSSCPIYFNAQVDILQCVMKLDSVFASFGEPIHHQNALSCFNESSDVASVRYLVLDACFWSSIIAEAPRSIHPIPELRLFSNLREIFLLVKPLGEYEDQSKAQDDLADALKDWFRHTSYDSYSSSSAERQSTLLFVPTSQMSREESSKKTKEWNLCFASGPPRSSNGLWRGIFGPWALDKRYWKQKPKIAEIRRRSR